LAGFAVVAGQGGRSADHLHAECGTSYTQPCRPGPNTACINRDGVPGRYRLDFSPDLNDGDFRLEANFGGGDVVFTDSGARWAFEVDPTADHLLHAAPANSAALDLWMVSPEEMAQIFGEHTQLFDGILGEEVSGVFRPMVNGDSGADFTSPRTYRFTVGLRF
jgi:hypothetical protein